jgi:hypothetical protein
MDEELKRITQQGIDMGIIRARLYIARWLSARKATDEYMSNNDMALYVLSMKIPDDETTE